MSVRGRRIGAWAIALVLVAGAGVLTAIKPADHAAEVPFTIDTAVGSEGVARNLAVTVHSVRFAPRVTGHPAGAGAADWTARGNWLVVDLDAAGVVDQQSSLLSSATLDVDGMVFSASERMRSLLREQLVPGVAKTGMVAFELPSSLRRGPAVLTFGTRPNNRLDSVVEVRIDLAHAGSTASVVIAEPSWSVR